MTRNYSIRTITLLVILKVITSSVYAQTKYSKEVQERIDQVEHSLLPPIQIEGLPTMKWTMDDRMKLYNIHGLSMAVIHNYKVEWVKAYGLADVSQNRAADNNTVFQVASLSKSLNAVGVLKLVQEKKLDLTSDINKFLKTWKFTYDSVSKNKIITLRHLLSHMGGLSTQSFPGYLNGTTLPSIEQILSGEKPANTEGLHSVFEPGLKYKYSGGGVTIAQLIVMNTAKMPYEKYMQTKIFKPIGMLHSFYAPASSAKINLLAAGYTGDGKEIEGKYHIYPESAAAGLWTNPTDLSNYVIEILKSYKGKSNKILSPEMTQLLLTPYIDSTAALGTFIVQFGKDHYFQHSGANQGYTSLYCGDLENGNGVVMMLNSDNGFIMNEIIKAVATTYQWPGFYAPEMKKLVTVPDDSLNAYLGDYSVGDIKIKIVRKSDGLWLTGPVTWKMHFTGSNEYFLFEDLKSYKFYRDEKGNIAGISLNGEKFGVREK